jgi:site-specific recombinase XerD
VSKESKGLVAGADLPPIRFHDLRHTAASLMLASGWATKTVSEVLGCLDITITGNIYAGVYEDATVGGIGTGPPQGGLTCLTTM